MGIPNTSRRTHVIRQDPSQPETIYAGTTTGLFKTVNSGKTWKTMTGAQVNALALDASKPGTLYLAMEYEGIAKSNNRGDTIEPVDNGFADRQISSVTASGSELVAIEPNEAETTGIFISANAGTSWTPLSDVHGLDGVHLQMVAGFAGQSRDLIAATSNGLYKSIDGGRIWRPLPIRIVVEEQRKPQPRTRGTHARIRRPVRTIVRTAALHPSTINGIYPIATGSGNLLFVATDLGLLKSRDMGERWQKIPLPLASVVSALYSAPAPAMRLVAKTNLGFFESKDCGEHWTAWTSSLPVTDVNAIAIPGDGSSALFAATRTGLYVSHDDGVTWKTASHVPVSTFTSVLYPSEGATAYAVEYGHLYRTADGGDSWSAVPTAIPALRIRRLWAAQGGSNRLYAITTGLGILFR
jgi:photosystem II stability/assembly factor-like uncharacterized protein